jgi:hypothetical protein
MWKSVHKSCTCRLQKRMTGGPPVCVAPVPRTFWLRSSRSVTELQCRIWDLKATGMTIRAIQEIVRDLPDPEQENPAVGHISTTCIHSSLRRTAIGRCWRPHQRSGPPRFLNLDEEIRLADWVNKQAEPPTIEDFLDQATELRRVSLTAVEPMLEMIVSL